MRGSRSQPVSALKGAVGEAGGAASARFAAELEALVAKYGQKLNDNEVITALEVQLGRAWADACEPQPGGLWAAAPALLRAIIAAEGEACRGLDEGDTREALIDVKYGLRAAIAKALGRPDADTSQASQAPRDEQ